MRKKLTWWLVGGVTVVVTMVGIVVALRRHTDLRVRAASAVNASPSPSGQKSARHVGAYTIPLTADGNAAGARSGRVGEILGSTMSSSAKAQALQTLFPQLSAAAQPAAAQHIVNLLPDSAYASFATHLTNASTSSEVRAVIYADLLHRPNAVKLPWLLATAGSPGVSQAGAAATLLQATLREDHGTNWNVWSDRIQAWLQLHPDEFPANAGN